jgi:hypothetical protein
VIASEGQPYYITGQLCVKIAITVTYASVEGKVGEIAKLDETSFVLGHAIADLSIDLRSGAFQRVDLVQLRDGLGILNPGKKLFSGHNPHWQ